MAENARCTHRLRICDGIAQFNRMRFGAGRKLDSISRGAQEKPAHSGDAGATSALFVAKGDYGVCAHGAARGDVAGGDSDERQQDGNASERERVMRGNAEELVGH